MPYITQEARRRIEQQGDPQTAGELNYVFTLASIGYLHRKGLSYQTISDVVAAFEVAKGEGLSFDFELEDSPQRGESFEDWLKRTGREHGAQREATA